MVDKTLVGLTVSELSPRIKKREVSPVEVVESALDAIERLNPRLNAFTTVCAEMALERAREAESEIARGSYRGPLHGIPLGIKDLTDTAGIPTQYGLGCFRGHVPSEDATVVRRLKEAGAVIVGKTATHEAGLGITTNNAFFGPTRNPWNLDRIPGGSSGGSAAAVAADMIVASTGNDGGGSVRVPSFYCGVPGVKPTLGLVSRFGLMGGGITSFATEGPICKSLVDCALMLNVLAGRDPKDPYTVKVDAPDYVACLEGDLKGFKVAVSEDLFTTPFDSEVMQAYERAVAILSSAGATVVEVKLPHQSLVPPAIMVVLGGEMAMLHRQWSSSMSVKYSEQVSAMVETSLALSIDDYIRGAIQREELRRDYEDVFASADVLLGPVSPVPAPLIGDDQITINGEKHDLLTAVIACTGAANLTGIPGVAVPLGLSRSGLPVGVQVMARHFNEPAALLAARKIEEAQPERARVSPELRAAQRA